MSDAQFHDLMVQGPVWILAIGSFIGVMVNLYVTHKIKKSVNGLMAERDIAKKAEGNLQGRAEQTAEQHEKEK